MIGQMSVVSHHLRSPLGGAIELTILFATICRIGCFDAQIGRL
jgi:hypothetical protein